MKTKFSILIISFTLLLSACGASNTATVASVGVDTSGSTNQSTEILSQPSDIIASAELVPAQEASLAFVAGGNVASVNVTVGQIVSEGDILIELDNTLAKLEVERAERNLREMTSPGAIAAAQEAVTIALENRDDEAFDVVALDYGRASKDMIDEIQAEITIAEKRLEAAEAAYDRVKDKPLNNEKRANGLLALNNAKNYLNGLRADYQWYISPPTDNDVAQTNAEADRAQAVYQEAVWYLAALNGENLPPEASGAQLAALQQAQADLIAAQTRLDQTRIFAPFDGIVAQISVSVGDFIAPAQNIVTISNLAQIQIKTTDLSERDVVRVKIGTTASVLIEALAESFPATVSSISPLANNLGGDVVYEVTLNFDAPPGNSVYGGMTAEVSIDEIDG